MASDRALSDAMRSRVIATLGPERVRVLTMEGRTLDRQHAMELAADAFKRAGAHDVD